MVTLGLLRYMTRNGLTVASVKVGPDYIDPTFHIAASGRLCINLDTWAMRTPIVDSLISYLSVITGASIILAEGAMGLFDGVLDAEISEIRNGSTASLSMVTNWPVILVISARGQTTSVAAAVQGFARFRKDVHIAGVILNGISSAKHARAINTALTRYSPETPLLGVIPYSDKLKIPSRHLGLVQASTLADLDLILETIAEIIGQHVNIEAIKKLAQPSSIPISRNSLIAPTLLPPLGQRIAVAWDDAFSFVYPFVLQAWRKQGAEIALFSPLNNEAPPNDCDAVYLPGGYPELYAGLLASNTQFISGLRAVAINSSSIIFGECGGYMILGRTLIDASNHHHTMADMLPLISNFGERKLCLGYRSVTLVSSGPLGVAETMFRGHEFHYASILQEGPGEPLFFVSDPAGQSLGKAGLKHKNVMGSFIHLIDVAES